jgi:hypothetical protein
VEELLKGESRVPTSVSDVTYVWVYGWLILTLECFLDPSGSFWFQLISNAHCWLDAWVWAGCMEKFVHSPYSHSPCIWSCFGHRDGSEVCYFPPKWIDMGFYLFWLTDLILGTARCQDLGGMVSGSFLPILLSWKRWLLTISRTFYRWVCTLLCMTGSPRHQTVFNSCLWWFISGTTQWGYSGASLHMHTLACTCEASDARWPYPGGLWRGYYYAGWQALILC